MKKLSLVLVAAIMIVFASCGSDSKQFKEWKSFCADFEKAIDKAKNCDDLEIAYEEFGEKSDELVDKYDEDMSEEEENEIGALLKRLEKKYERREDALCD